MDAKRPIDKGSKISTGDAGRPLNHVPLHAKMTTPALLASSSDFLMRSLTLTVYAIALIAMGALANAADEPKLTLQKGDHVVLIGNTLAERMQYFGNFETLLHSRFPDLELVVRDLGWSADELML